MTNVSKHCIWLTFQFDLLEEIVINLAKRFQGPVFQPHCTLIGKTDIPIIKLKSAVISTADKFDLAEIHIEKAGFSRNVWRSFYLELKENDALIKLHERLIELLSLESSEEFLPHVSLMYNSISETIKRNIELPIEIGKSIPIRSIQITECGNEVENWKPVFELMIN